jgi:hypothetical protein
MKGRVMELHRRGRRSVVAALAFAFGSFALFGQLAAAAPKSDTGREIAPGQTKKAEEPAPSDGTPTAADHPEGYSTHDASAANGPGGQVCDGDPNNAPGAGGNYENTCPAGPSQNGAGDGKATGKPCAGCVGNADDKNPKGQADSGPSDHNNGYECDQKGRSTNEGNNGVGFGNPAHTGCVGATSVTPTCPDGSAMPTGNITDCGPETCPNGTPLSAEAAKGCTPKTTCPDGKPMPASGAVADCAVVTQGHSTAVLGEVLTRPVEVAPAVEAVAATAPPAAPSVAPVAVQPQSLARTGFAGFTNLLGLALVLALGGLALLFGVRVSRVSGAVG